MQYFITKLAMYVTAYKVYYQIELQISTTIAKIITVNMSLKCQDQIISVIIEI